MRSVKFPIWSQGVLESNILNVFSLNCGILLCPHVFYHSLLTRTVNFGIFLFVQYAELESLLGEIDRARAIYELAINRPLLDMPELLWKAYIDFEIEQCDWERSRLLYRRLLQRTQHVKVINTSGNCFLIPLRSFMPDFWIWCWGIEYRGYLPLSTMRIIHLRQEQLRQSSYCASWKLSSLFSNPSLSYAINKHESIRKMPHLVYQLFWFGVHRRSMSHILRRECLVILLQTVIPVSLAKRS